MKIEDITKKIRLMERLTGTEVSTEALATAHKIFKDKTEEEFLDYVPMFIYEANKTRKLLKQKSEEKLVKSRIISLN